MYIIAQNKNQQENNTPKLADIYSQMICQLSLLINKHKIINSRLTVIIGGNNMKAANYEFVLRGDLQ